jgi:hypothetical protein
VNLVEFRKLLGRGTPEEKIRACYTVDRSIKTLPAANKFISSKIFWLLHRDSFIEAAHLLWGADTFDPRPMACRRILHALQTYNRVIILGASASSKSHTCIVWIFLQWLQDVTGTGARIISSSAGHAMNNTFSTLQKLHQTAIIPLPGICQSTFIGLDTKIRHCSLQVVPMSPGDTKNVLQGTHPQRRQHPDPKYGPLTRMRLMCDEIEMVNEAQLYDAIDNVLSTENGRSVSICATSNPRNVTSRLAQEAEPPGGWHSVDPMEDLEWTSKRNYRVLRINALKSENVVTGKLIYPGLMTREGYMQYLSKTGGNDPEFYTFVLGLYPLEGVSDCLIPYSFIANMWGDWIFAPGAYDCVSVDVAHEGDDLCIACVGRYGLATSVRPANSNQIIKLMEPRYSLQIYQFHSIPKGMVHETHERVRALAQKYGIRARNISIDKTGNGYGLYCEFVESGWDVLGVAWGAAASHCRILDIHKNYANEIVDGCAAEQYHAFAAWLQADLIRVSSCCESDRFVKGLTGRKMKPSRRKGATGEPLRRIEEKRDFKSRMGWSCDHADSAVQLLHLIRMRGNDSAAQTVGRKVPVPNVYPNGDQHLQHVKMIDWGDGA